LFFWFNFVNLLHNPSLLVRIYCRNQSGNHLYNSQVLTLVQVNWPTLLTRNKQNGFAELCLQTC